MSNQPRRQSPDSLSGCVVEAVAERKGVDSTELSTALYDVVDGDALDSVFLTDQGHITFPYEGYVVTVHADGHVELMAEETRNRTPTE